MRGKSLLSAIVCAITWLPAFGAPAHSGEPVQYDLKIESQPLGKALQEFAKQSGVQVIFFSRVTEGHEAPALKGKFTVAAALERLLTDSQLTFRELNPKTIEIRPQAAVNLLENSGEPLANELLPRADPMISEARGERSSRLRIAQVDEGASTSADRKARTDDRTELGEMIVTGSRLPQVAKEGVQPVRTYTRQDIQRSGQTGVAGFLNTLPDASIGLTESALQTFAAATTVRLHGLPVGTTLVLLDGRRVQTNTAAYFDLNNIPMAAVDRIDVLPVGSSAVYGSDALAGAVNIILRDDFKGFEVDGRYGSADGFDETSAALAWGTAWDSGGLSLVANYQDRGELLGSEREPTSTTDQPASRVSSVRDWCFPGTVYSVDGQPLPGLGTATRAAIPAGITGTPTMQDFQATAGQTNQCNYLEGYTVLTPAERAGGLLYAHQRLNESMDLFFQTLYSEQETRNRRGGFIRLFNGINTVSADNPFNPFGVDLFISYNNPDHWSGYDAQQSFFRPLVGTRGSIGEAWDYEVTAFLSRDRSDLDRNDTNRVTIEAALDSTDPATALNPFTSGAPGSPQLIESLLASGAHRIYHYENELYGGQAFLRGKIANLSPGPLSAVFGAEYSDERQYARDPFSAAPSQLSRTAYAVFTEERVPLLAADAGPGEKLAITLAARFDHSSDFGGETTGQGGVEWRPIESLLFRGGYALSYRSPQLLQLSDTVFFDFPVQFVDPLRGNENVVVDYEASGNPNVQPETGDARTLGVVYSSRKLPGFETSLTYFGIEIENFITLADGQQLINDPSLIPGSVTRGPVPPGDPFGVGPVTNVRTTYFNFGRLEVEGFNLDVSYRAKTAIGEITPSLSLTNTIKWDSAITPGAPTVSYVDQATRVGPGFAPRWKGTVALNWDTGPSSLNLAGRYTGDYRDYQDSVPNTNELGGFWLLDANFRYDLGKTFGAGNTLLRKTYVELGGTNLLDEDLDYSYSGTGYDPTQYDIVGRLLYARLNAQW